MATQHEPHAHNNDHDHDHDHDSLVDVVMDKGFWNERYGASTALWSGQPNPQLITQAADLTPGSALDVGCGEGADAIWLATQGWRVTGMDVSSVALERAAAHARNVGDDQAQRITWLQADLTDWVAPTSTWELVSAQYMQPPRAQRGALFGRLAAAVSPGGSLLVIGHHPSDLQTTVPRPPVPELFFTPTDIADLLDPRHWDIVVSEVVPRSTVDPDGHTVDIHDAVLRARRIG